VSKKETRTDTQNAYGSCRVFNVKPGRKIILWGFVGLCYVSTRKNIVSSPVAFVGPTVSSGLTKRKCLRGEPVLVDATYWKL
jgi:hypothetical protein